MMRAAVVVLERNTHSPLPPYFLSLTPLFPPTLFLFSSSSILFSSLLVSKREYGRILCNKRAYQQLIVRQVLGLAAAAAAGHSPPVSGCPAFRGACIMQHILLSVSII